MNNAFEQAFWSYGGSQQASLDLFQLMEKYEFRLYGIKIDSRTMAKIRHELQMRGISMEQFG